MYFSGLWFFLIRREKSVKCLTKNKFSTSSCYQLSSHQRGGGAGRELCIRGVWLTLPPKANARVRQFHTTPCLIAASRPISFKHCHSWKKEKKTSLSQYSLAKVMNMSKDCLEDKQTRVIKMSISAFSVVIGFLLMKSDCIFETKTGDSTSEINRPIAILLQPSTRHQRRLLLFKH